jgi:acyl-CoA reductase-like NAD-dependent aldehyde dehydrogenase
MSGLLRTLSPVDGRVYVERPLAEDAEIEAVLAAAVDAQIAWRRTPLERRREILGRAVAALVAEGAPIAEEQTWQMGRPIAHTPGELRGLTERATTMIGLAEQALAPIRPPAKPGFDRHIRRVPVGVVAVIAPWNYPYLTSVNVIVPALLAGNAVILKPSHQTPLTAERYAAAFDAAGLPAGLFGVLHLDHGDTARLIADRRIGYVSFTGSVAGGLAVRRALADRFIGMGLELGGKDPAYVRADARLEPTVESLVDGAFYNAGQSCCGIERIYVHATLFDRFVESFAALTSLYRLGNPLDAASTLGPMVRKGAADLVRAQTAEAIARGARGLIDTRRFAADDGNTAYLAPQVLIDVDHRMRVMREESFGPVVGIMKVANDDEAIALMNDSPYGLTASLWSEDAEVAAQLGERLETGTVFLNRCDVLDPTLAWTGVKDSGMGCSLSLLGFEALTRPQSYHFRLG